MESKKRIIAFMLTLCLVFVCAPTISYAEPDEDEYTTDTKLINYGNNDGVKFIDTISDERKNAVRSMRKRALYEWSYNESQPYKYYFKDKDDYPNAKITLVNGPYRGLPYQQKGYEKSDPTQGNREKWYEYESSVQKAVDTAVKNKDTYINGSDCSSSVCYAWREAVLGSNDRSSGILMSTKGRYNNQYRITYTTKKIVMDGNDTSSNNAEGYGNYVKRVGQYGQAAQDLSNDTKDMLTKLKKTGNFTNNASVYLRVYSKMQPGDILVCYTNSRKHARLIEGVFIVKKTDGTIDPDKSYVIVTEQTGTMYDCTNNAIMINKNPAKYKTTWLTAYGKQATSKSTHDYSFTNIAEDYYLPYEYNGNTTSSVLSFTVSPESETSLNASWYAQNDEYCDGYELEYSEDSSFDNAKVITLDDASESSVSIDNLDKDKEYYLRVRSYAINEDGEIEYSGYNNWVEADVKNGTIYRENAPDPQQVSAKEYFEYIYDDISYEEECEEACEELTVARPEWVLM